MWNMLHELNIKKKVFVSNIVALMCLLFVIYFYLIQLFIYFRSLWHLTSGLVTSRSNQLAACVFELLTNYRARLAFGLTTGSEWKRARSGWQADSGGGVMSGVMRMRAGEVTRSVPECCLVNRHGSTWWRPPQSLSTAPPLRVPQPASFPISSNGSHIFSLPRTGSDLRGPGGR